jgi:hypothetical protein
MSDNPYENIEKMGKLKKVMVVLPQDFPYMPGTSEYITGVKAMEFLEIGYELTSYLDNHIKDSTLSLKDLVVEMFGEGDWGRFCNEYKHPETNADGFCDWLNNDDYLYPYENVIAIETDDAFMFVPLSKEDGNDNYDAIGDLRYLVQGMCSLFSISSQKQSSSDKKSPSMPLAKAEVKPNASVSPMFEPAFTKL